MLSRFFAIELDRTTALQASYDPVLVSILIAALAGFAFIRLSHRVAAQTQSTGRQGWIIGGALVMGAGVWAMHFIGMLAYRIPIPIQYDPLITFVSALPAIAASAWSLHLISQPDIGIRRLILGGVVLGGGIGLMHYVGMAAMELSAFIRYDPMRFVASILIAVVLAVSALAISRPVLARPLYGEICAALLIGLAVSGMHYTAMASTLCFVVPDHVGTRLSVDTDIVATATTVVAAIILLSGIAMILFDQRLSHQIQLGEAAQRRAQEVDRRLTEAVESMPGCLALFDRAGRMQVCNARFRETYNLGPDQPVVFNDVLRHHVMERERHGSGQDAGEDIARQMQDGYEAGTPVTLKAPDGAWSMIRQTRTATGDTVFLRTDITESKQTEIELSRQQQRLNRIMDNVADALVTVEQSGVITSCNRATERIFGYPREQTVGQNLSLLLPRRANIRERAYREFLHRQAQRGETFEIAGRHRDGHEIYLEAVFSEVLEDENPILIAAIRDITDRRLTAIALEGARVAAERASNAKTEFISHMSHELRTPLNAIIGMTEALLTIDRIRTDPDRLHGYLTDIHASGRHQLALVNNILELSTIEGGGRKVHIETFDLLREAESAIGPIRSLLAGHTAPVPLRVSGDPVSIRADRQSVNQVILNLVSNAILHGGEGVTVDVRVHPGSGGTADESPAENMACLEVSDTGRGIPEDLLRHIGQPFPQINSAYTRARGETDQPSTGLGLSIVDRLMGMNGGHYRIDSRVGVGTTVTTFWPKVRAVV